MPEAQRTAYCEFIFIYSQNANDVYPAQVPVGEDLRTLLATRTMQSVRSAVGRVTRANLQYTAL